MNAYEVKAGMLQVKLCDPCLSALKWFVYNPKRYTSALLYLYLNLHLGIIVFFCQLYTYIMCYIIVTRWGGPDVIEARTLSSFSALTLFAGSFDR